MAKKKKYAVLPDGRRIEVTGMSSQQTKKLNKKATTYEAPVKEIKITDKSDMGPVKTTVITEADRANMSLLEKMKYGVERGKQTPVGSLQNLYKAPKDSGLEIINKDALKKGNALQITAGTAGDIALNVAHGTGNLAEGVADFILYGASGIADLAGAQNASDYLKRTAQDKAVDNALKELEEKADKYSLLGETTDSFLQGLGYVGGMIATGGAAGAAGMGTAGVSALTKGVMFAGSAGSGISEALNSGATDKEAITYGAIKGAGDVITEMMFGGLGRTVKATGFSTGLSSADDILAKKLSGMVTSKLAKNLTEFGVKASAEGLEEVMAGIVSAVGKKITYMSEEDMMEIMEDEKLLEQFLMGAATSAAMQSGAIPGTKKGSLIESTKKGADFITGLTDNEQKVVDKEIENRIKEKEKDGKKLRAQEKNRIIDQVNSDLDKGYISIDTIESVLGGDTYNKYKELNDRETSLQEEFDHLNKMKQGDMTGEQVDRRIELKQQLADLKASPEKGQIKDRLTKEVQEMVKSDRLMESYNEKSRRSQAYEADLTKCDEKQQAVIKKAAESGILNNTRRTHEFVDMIAKISADKGVLFDFTNNEKIKSSGFAVEGKTVNGYIKDGAVTLNINSAKALNKVVGHEITHVLEGTELYTELQNAVKSYAETKGEYSSRLESVKALYEDVEGANVENELTADLVGDYLFTDESFVSNLSAKNPNIFKKIYDEIKYLVKVVTAGSKEARELEKVKRTFEKAYKETANTPNDTKYMLQKEVKNVAERLSGREWNRVKEAVSNYNNLNHSYEKSADGDIIIPVNNKLVYTDGDYDSPGINKVIEFDSDTETEIDEARSWIYGAEKGEYTLADAYEIIEMLAGNEIISEYSEKGSKSGKRYDRRTGRGKSRSDSYHAGFLQERIGRANEIIGNVNNSQEASSEGDVFFDGEKNVKYSISEDDQVLTEEQEKLIRDTIEVLFSKNYGKDTYTVLAYDKNDKATYVNHSATKEELSKYFGTEIAEEISKHMIELKNYKLDEKFLELPANKDSEGRALSKEQKEYFKNVIPELKDDNGNLKVLYHGTPNDFTQFNYDFIESNGTALGKGFYLTDSKDVANGYTGKNGKVMELYAVIEKPLSLTEKNIKKAQYKKFVKAVDKATKGEYLSNYGEVEYEGYNTVLNRALEDFRYDDNDVDLIHGVLNASGLEWEEGFRLLKKTLGYDGVIQQNFNGTGSTVFIPTLPEQIKSVTNTNPTNNPDINLSLSKDDIAPTGNYNVYGKDIALEQATAQEDIAPVRSDIKAKKPFKEAAPLTKDESQIISQEQENIADNNPLEDLQEASKEEVRIRRAQYHEQLINNIKDTFDQKGYDFDEVLGKAKNKSTFSSVDNTPQRFLEKSLGYKEGQILSDLTANQTAQNESAAIKWINSYTGKNGLLRKISKEYSIKPGSKESAAAQMYAEGFYANDKGELIKYGDAELAKDFPDTRVQQNIKGLASDARIRKIYDDTLDAINASRTRNIYPAIPKRDNYFLHFRAMEDTFSRLGLPFNPNDIRAKDLPTDLNGVTADLKPGQPYFSSAMQRKGVKTTYDLLGGVERYLNSAKNQIYHIDDIQTLRALRNYIADRFGQAKGLEGIDEMTSDEAAERISQVYGSHLSVMAKHLNEQANTLAGKTALIDRGIEGLFGRRALSTISTINNLVGKNMVGFNVSSALTNSISVVQSIAKTNKFDCLKAFAQTASNRIGRIFGKDDGFAESNPAIIRRKGIEKFQKTPVEKISDAGYWLASAVDDISTEFIVRTKYNEFTRKGMEEQQAHYEADKWASRLLGDRSLGQMPQLFNSKTLGVLTKFQLELRNQLDSMFYDTIQEKKVQNEEVQNKLIRNAFTAAKVTGTVAQLAVLQHIVGAAFESVAGYNPTFDMIETLMTVFGYDDEEDSEDTALDNIEQGILALINDLPYSSTFTGGRVPIASAIPITEFVTGVDEYGQEKSRWETIKEAASYYNPIGGWGQAKKTIQGLGMFDEDLPIKGSYTQSGNLRFPVEDTLLNRAQAAVFGQYANENARYYFDNDIAPLKEKQIEEYKELDIPIKDYWDYRKGLSGLKKLNEKGDYIGGLDLPVSKKNILINNIADRKVPIDYTGYENFADFEEFDFAQRYPEKYAVLQEQGISVADYKKNHEQTAFMYTDDYSWASKNPEKYTLSKAVTDDVTQYKQYTSDLNDIRADKDSNGKSISGTAKEKKIDYINSLDIDYGAKLVLFKSQYKADDTYNSEIIDYLNEREDISAKERKTILKELGFTVDSKGNARW